MKIFLSIVFGVVLVCPLAGCDSGGSGEVEMKKAPAVRPEALKPDAGAKEGKYPSSSAAPMKKPNR